MKSLLPLLTGLLLILSNHADAQTSPCKDNEIYQKLDFWVGEWNVKNPQGQPSGVNKISKILDGCALLEEWTGSGPSRGKSLNFYDAQKNKWQQVWINNFGNPLYLDGFAGKDSMTYTGTSFNQQGILVMNEMILSKIDENNVRQLWHQSSDNGVSWTVAFDGHYIRKD